VAWYDANSGNKFHPTGRKIPNELSIYDMKGLPAYIGFNSNFDRHDKFLQVFCNEMASLFIMVYLVFHLFTE